MSIELSVRGIGQDQSQSLVVDAGFALARATEITLPNGAPAVVRHEKFGRDLSVRFEDGQTLRVENFFVIDPEGEFSRLLGEDGGPTVTGLIAPEPSMEDMGAEGETDPVAGAGGGNAAPQQAFAPDGSSDAAEGFFFGESSTILRAGAGLAAGYGSMTLMSSEGDEDDSESHSAPSARTVLNDADAGLLEQELEALLGAPVAEDDLSRALNAEFATAQDALVDDALGMPGDPADPLQDGGLSAPFFAETSPMPVEIHAETDLLLPLTAEGDS